MAVTVRMSMTSFHNPHKFLHTQESDDPSQNPEAYRHIVRVVVALVTVTVGVRVTVILSTVTVGRHCMRDKVKKRVP